MSFKVEELPYAMDALSPHISKETFEYHYGKHYQTYVGNLNKLTEGKPEGSKSLEDLVRSASGGLFNNAAQVWNHMFYWKGLSPNGGGEPEGAIKDAIGKNFGSFKEFQTTFTQKSVTLFGSGWAWLVKNADGNLEIVQSKDADNPMTKNQKPILTCDVWEHAYYIDYRNARPKYLEAFWKVVNWEFADKNL